MKGNFELAINFILLREGYKSEDPDDPGGRTIYGISERYHPEVVARLWDMDKEAARLEATKFYRKEYWDAVDGDFHPAGIDIFLMDTAVNLGAEYSRGLFGIALEYMLKRYPGTLQSPYTGILLAQMALLRIRRYCELAGMNRRKIKYLRGWTLRVLDLWELCENAVK